MANVVDIVDPVAAGLVFQPQLRSLRVSIGAPIHFDFEVQQICLDRTPTAEPTLVPIADFAASDGVVEFRAAGKRYRIVADHALGRVLVACLAALDVHGCVVGDEPYDAAEFEIEDAVMTSTVLRRTTPGSAHETLRIFREDGRIMRLIPVHAIRTPVQRLSAANGRVTCVSETGAYEFALRLPEPLLTTVPRLIELGWT